MITQQDVDNTIDKLRGHPNDDSLNPYDPAFVEFVRTQTQLMLEMRDLLTEIRDIVT